MKQAILVSVLVVALAGCAPPPSMQPSSPGPQVQGSGLCDASKVAWAVGKVADQETMRRVWKESGAGLLRPLAPRQAATLDHRPDRVNVHIDAANVIGKIDCG